ncbi:DDE-type integrase/transposase/recombinase [Natronolimnobius sp. AArcel1]|nr:DDE-type integrase/transposase/recombinase [Natronolimnobius sp. AArcel1]
MSVAIYIDTKFTLNPQLFRHHGTDLAAAFLYGLREKHNLFETVFLVDQCGYRTSLGRFRLNARVDYTDRNLIEKWFRTLRVCVDRFHTSWVDSRRNGRKYIDKFIHYCNHQRPPQSLNGKTPVDEVRN